MKKIIYCALAALVCSCTSNNFTVNGDIQGVVAGDSVMIYSYYDINVRYGGAKLTEDGVFEISGNIKEPALAALVVNGNSLVGAFFLEDGEINLSASEAGVVFSGTTLNDLYNDYTAKSAEIENKYIAIDTTLPSEELTAQQDVFYNEYMELIHGTVDANLDNVLGAFIFANDEFTVLNAPEAKKRIGEFSPELLEVNFMSDLAEAVEIMLLTEVGQPYTDVTLVNIFGERTSIAEYLAQGKYVLIDFWATWCSPCIAEMPYLKEAYAKYSKKGLEIYSISLDENPNDWAEFVGESLPWVNVIDMPTVAASSLYAIRTIPSNFLVSPEGVIVAKNLRGEELVSALAEFIK